MPRRVAVVAHTHWDREWYLPVEGFRPRLVGVVDQVLETLEADPDWSFFLLDGQVAALDDYLVARPGAEHRCRLLIGEGRLGIGPWYVLMDELCVSGETLVRNLQLGLSRAKALGATAKGVGYLPDMFGHTAQMPQILRLAGISHAVVWRGVPAGIESTGFWWESPGGIRVRAEQVVGGYANGAYLPHSTAEFLRRVEALEAEAASLLTSPEVPLLILAGGDHQPLQPHLRDLLAAANDGQDRFAFVLTSLVDYLADAPSDALPLWRGELRSSAHAPVLAGVASTRADVKTAAAAAELALERLAEPLAALWLPPEMWPAQELGQAWLEVVRNSAHDSICGCCADEVARSVLARYDTARAIADALVSRSASIAAVATAGAGTLVLNPSAHPRCAAVELVMPGAPEPLPTGTQLLSEVPPGTETREGTGQDFARLLAELTREGWLGEAGRCTVARLDVASPTSGDPALVLRLVHDPCRRPDPASAAVMAEAWAQAGARPDSKVAIVVERAATREVVALSGDVPGFGWALWQSGPLPCAPVRPAGHLALDNGLLHLAVDPFLGTFSVNGLAGLDLLVDGGEAGDTYNYCPPEEDVVIDKPFAVEVELIEAGPVRGKLRVLRRFTWPAGLDGDRRTGLVPVEVTTDLVLVAGERAARVETRFDNRCRDHRVRTLFRLPEKARTTRAGSAFAFVDREKNAEGGPLEPSQATFPARGFVSAGGLTLAFEGVKEYELIDGGKSLALTLLRSTGVLARPLLETRPSIAGPAIPVEGAQQLGSLCARYAVVLGDADPWRLVEDLWTPLVVIDAAGGGDLPARGSRLEVEGAVVSALRRGPGGRLELRVFNPTELPTLVRVPRRRGTLVDLTGDEVATWEDAFDLGPWQIATALLDVVNLDS